MTMRRNTWWNKVVQLVCSCVLGSAMIIHGAGERAVCAQEVTTPPAPPVAPATAARPKRLTNEELKTITENLGYEPEADMKGDKINLIYLQWKQGTFQFHLYLSVSDDGDNLIVQSPLRGLPADESAYGKELSGVLAKTFLLTPSHFVVDETRWLRLIRFVPAQGLTPAKLRKVIAEFTDQVRNSESIWRCDRWEPKATIVAKPVAVIPQLEGNWKITLVNASGEDSKQLLETRKVSISIVGDQITFFQDGAANVTGRFRAGDREGTFDIIHAADRIEKSQYVRQGNKVKFAFSTPGTDRPTDFTCREGVTVIEGELVAK